MNEKAVSGLRLDAKKARGFLWDPRRSAEENEERDQQLDKQHLEALQAFQVGSETLESSLENSLERSLSPIEAPWSPTSPLKTECNLFLPFCRLGIQIAR